MQLAKPHAAGRIPIGILGGDSSGRKNGDVMNRRVRSDSMTMNMALGAGLGAAIGAALDNVALWVAVGVALGSAFGVSGVFCAGSGHPDVSNSADAGRDEASDR